MKSSRVSLNRGRKVIFEFDGNPIEAYEGETVAAALLANDIQVFGVTSKNTPRAPLCNMGTCFDCAVSEQNGQRLIRSCLTDVTEGMALKKYEAS